MLLETISRCLGDYAIKLPHNFLTASKYDRHSTELADLRGTRLAVAVETGEEAPLCEVRVKELTGGDTIRARKLYKDFSEFRPSHTMILATNHLPSIHGTDHGMWRRIRVVPFDMTIPEERQDQNLASSLEPEYPGILWWLVQGCLDYQTHGLAVPSKVKQVTTSYRKQSDVIQRFIDDCCQTGLELSDSSQNLLTTFSSWAEKNGEQILSSRMFGSRLKEKGFQGRKSGKMWYVGIHVREGWEDEYALSA